MNDGKLIYFFLKFLIIKNKLNNANSKNKTITKSIKSLIKDMFRIPLIVRKFTNVPAVNTKATVVRNIIESLSFPLLLTDKTIPKRTQNNPKIPENKIIKSRLPTILFFYKPPSFKSVFIYSICFFKFFNFSPCNNDK